MEEVGSTAKKARGGRVTTEYVTGNNLKSTISSLYLCHVGVGETHLVGDLVIIRLSAAALQLKKRCVERKQ